MTGIAFAWMAPTTLFGSVVKNAKMSFVVSPSLIFRTEVQRVQRPAKKASGRVSSNANQTGGWVPSGSMSFSEKLVKGTTHRLSTPSQRLQCGDFTLRTLVTPGSDFFPLRANTGDGMPQRAIVSSRPSWLIAHDRSRVIREDARERREIPHLVAHGARQFADRLLAFRYRIQVAQRPASSSPHAAHAGAGIDAHALAWATAPPPIRPRPPARLSC